MSSDSPEAIELPQRAGKSDVRLGPAHLSLPYAIGIACLMVAGSGAVVLLNRGKPWITSDGATYLGVASNLAHGRGVTVPFRGTLDPFSVTPSATVQLLRWPPGYPAVLAGFVVIGLAPATAAEVVDAICVAALVGIVAALVWHTQRRPGLAVLGAGLMLGSTPLLADSRYALSDTLFLSLVAGFVYLAVRVGQGRSRLLWAMALVATAATMVRWAGVALLLPSAGACVIGRRPRAVVPVAALQVGVPALWVVGTRARTAHLPREVFWHPSLRLSVLSSAVGTWVTPVELPSRWYGSFGVALAVAVVLTAGYVVVRRTTSPFRPVVLSLLLSYGAVLIFTRLWFDAAISWDNRILAPIYLLVVLLALDLAGDTRGLPRSLAYAGLVWLSLAQLSGWPSLARQSTRPLGYTSQPWRAVPAVQIAARVATIPVLVSNRPDVVYLLLHRSALTVPWVINPVTTKRNDDLSTQLSALASSITDRAALIYFDDLGLPRPYQQREPALVASLGVRLVASFPGARIYTR